MSLLWPLSLAEMDCPQRHHFIANKSKRNASLSTAIEVCMWDMSFGLHYGVPCSFSTFFEYQIVLNIIQVTWQSKAQSYTRLKVMICQILPSQIASVVELGSLGQLLWRDSLKHDTDDLISEKFSLHRIHVMVLEYGCLVLVAIFSARRP